MFLRRFHNKSKLMNEFEHRRLVFLGVKMSVFNRPFLTLVSIIESSEIQKVKGDDLNCITRFAR